MDADRILAFRCARSGLAERAAGAGLAAALACPAADNTRDGALLALAARAQEVTREGYERAVDAGEVVVAYSLRGAIHALAPGDVALYGRALLASDDDELAAQLGTQVQRLAAEHGFAPSDALAQVAQATRSALADGRRLDKNALHAEWRERLPEHLLPWCRGCGSHHVAPMLWRYATIEAGVRLDSQRRYLLADPGPAPPAAEAVRRFLGFYGPSTPGDFVRWAGIATPHGRRLWDEVADELAEVRRDGRRAWLLEADAEALASPPRAHGIRLLPPGDPFMQAANRDLLVGDREVRKKLFRPVASPGAVLHGGRLGGLWRARARRAAVEVTVEALAPLPREQLETEAGRVAALRGARRADLVVA